MTATSTAASSLPPVRTSCHVPLSLMTSISEETIALWLKLGALEKLEQAVLDGYGDQLCGKTSRIPQVNKFLKQVPLFQSKIREIHQSVSQGRLRDVQHLIDRKKLAFCRDHNGASPLHKAVIFGHQDVIEYLAKRYGSVIHIRDHQGRTALHYAAFLPDRGEIYQYLLALGADERAMDVYGRQPSYYLDGQNESTLRQLRDGSTLNGIRKIKPRYYGQVTTGQPFTNSNKSTVSKSHIREIISEGDVSALEDLVLQGQGDRLLGETSAIPKVQSFLNIVPMYMERIYDVHRAVMRDQLEHVAILLENRKLALARDQLGATPLHKAVWFGHYKIAHFISHHFQETLNAIDLEGRTALHYAAALKDSKNMYGILMEAGANKGIYDNKGKTADYYSQYPEHLNLEEVIKRCHKVNANYLANTASRIKGKSPVRQTPPPSNGNLSSPRSEENNGSSKENSQSNDSGNENELISMLQKDKFSKRLDINSANIRKWVNSKDVEKLTKAVMEGYGDKVVRVHTTDESEDKDEIASKITEMVDRVNAIHTAVSSDDLNELQNHLDEKDFALAKDHMGMTPLHKAVLLRKTKIVGFLIEKFPETINAKNKNGLTALHYSAAMSRKDGQQLYKMLLQAGADPKIRDNHGRTPDYYKTHLITLPNKGMIKTRPVGGRSTETLNRYSKQGVLERMTTALQRGDVELLQDLVLEGHGKHLLGKTSWHEEVKNFLKELPAYLNSIQSFHEAIQKSDVDRVREHISTNEKLMKARDDSGSMPIHIAALAESPEVLQYFAKNYPNLLNAKDATGKTALHIVSQKGNQDLHKLLKQSGADAKILDLKGKTADFYLQNSKPDSALLKQSNHVSKVSPNTSSDSMYSNSSREDVPKTPGKFLKRKSSKSLVTARKHSTVGMNVKRKSSQELLNNEIASTEPDEVNDEPGEENHDANPSNEADLENEQKAASRENETNNELDSEVKVDDEKVDNVSTEVTGDLSEDIAEEEEGAEDIVKEGGAEDIVEEGGADNTNENVNESNKKEEEEKEEPETATEATETAEENTQDETTDDIAELDENLDKEEVTEPENEHSESRKNSNMSADSTDIPPDKDVDTDIKETETNDEDVDAIDIDPPPDKDNEVEDSPKVSEKEENEEEETADADKDTGEAEDSLSQSEDSNATVIENAVEENVENNDNSIENVESEDEDAPKTASQRQSIGDVDSALANIQNWEGKTVAEVGSGNMADSMEVNDEPTPGSTSDTEDGVDNDAEVKQLVDDNDNTEEPSKDETEGDITDVKEEHVTENEDQNNNDNQILDETEEATENAEVNETEEATENAEVNETEEATENAEVNETSKSTDEVVDEENAETNISNGIEDTSDEKKEDSQDPPEETIQEEEIAKDENKIENNEDTKEEAEDNCESDMNKPSEVDQEESKHDEIDQEEKEHNENNENNQEENESNQKENEQNENLTENLTNNNGSTSNNPPADTPHQTKDHLDELIEHWIKEGDLLRLEHVVLAGQGDRLIERTSDDKQVQDFLDLVPIYMAKIRAVHEAVAKGQLREVRSILTRKRFALSRDHVGASPLHLAVLHGHTDVSTYIISHFPETMDGPDNEGRTPLHYATALHDNGTLYRLLKAAGADENIEDKGGHSPKFYMHHPGTLTLTQLLEPYSLTE